MPTASRRGGPDALDGKVDAGSGNDTVYARGTARAQIRCGRGRDVAHADAGDRVARDCERLVGRSAQRAPATPRATYADTIAATPGLAYWWRLNEQHQLGLFSTSLSDVKTGASASYFGKTRRPRRDRRR